MGCGMIVLFSIISMLLYLGIVAALGEDLVLILTIFGFLGYGLIRLLAKEDTTIQQEIKSSEQKRAANDVDAPATQKNSGNNTTIPAKPKEASLKSEPVQAGEYQILVKNNQVELVRFTSVDADTIVVPGVLNNFPVRMIGKGAFKDCKQMTKVIIPEGVSVIQAEAFCGCTKLSEIVLPSTLKDIGKYAFSRCSMLKTIYLPDGVRTVPEKCFSHCSNLRVVHFPESLRTIEKRAFYKTCLGKIEMPDTVQRIQEGAFSDCNWLEKVTLSDGLYRIDGEAFAYCKALKEIIIPKNVTEIAADAFRGISDITLYCYGASYGLEFAREYNLQYKDAEELKKVKQPKKQVSDNQTISVRSQKTLTEMHSNDESVKSLELRIGDYEVAEENGNLTIKKFLGTGDTVIHIPGVLNGKTVRIIDTFAFQDCPYIEKVVISEGITDIRKGAFRDCVNLKEAVLPSTLKTLGEDIATGKEKIQRAVFQHCALESIVIPNSVTIIGDDAFHNNRRLSRVSMSDSVEYLGSYAFAGTALREISLPLSLKSIEEGTFQHSELEAIKVPDSVKNIGGRAFYNCKYLKDVKLPDSLKEIGDAAFRGCTSLQELILPETVIHIGQDVFKKIGGYGTTNLDIMLYCYTVSPSWGYARKNKLKYRDAAKIEQYKELDKRVPTNKPVKAKVKTEISEVKSDKEVTEVHDNQNDASDRQDVLIEVCNCLKQIYDKQMLLYSLKITIQSILDKQNAEIAQNIANAPENEEPSGSFENDLSETAYGRVIRHSKYNVIFQSDYEDKGKAEMDGNIIIWEDANRISWPFNSICGCEYLKNGRRKAYCGQLTKLSKESLAAAGHIQRPKHGLIVHFKGNKPYVILDFVRSSENLEKVYETMKYVLGDRSDRCPFRRMGK